MKENISNYESSNIFVDKYGCIRYSGTDINEIKNMEIRIMIENMKELLEKSEKLLDASNSLKSKEMVSIFENIKFIRSIGFKINKKIRK